MKRIVLLLALVAAFTACHKNDSETPMTTNGTLKVRLTDAPAVYDSVKIEIVGVEVHSDQTGWIAMNVPTPGIYDLLQYSNGLDTLIATTTLPAGNVSQIRLLLGTNNSVTKNGVTYPLTIPSGSESGLKLQIHQEIVGGVTTIILLDFDAGRSIVEQGNGSFHLKPVLRTVVQGIDGAIHGTIDPAFAAMAYAINGADTFTGSIALPSGEFLISGVPAGNYTVCIYPAAVYSDTCISNVNVTVNAVTEMGTIHF
jgi:hypothetical protein